MGLVLLVARVLCSRRVVYGLLWFILCCKFLCCGLVFVCVCVCVHALIDFRSVCRFVCVCGCVVGCVCVFLAVDYFGVSPRFVCEM